MKLPEIASKRNRIRDAKILQLYVEKALTQADISERFGLSQSRINQILKSNAHLVLREKDWNKIQRLNLIKNQLNREEVKSIAVSPDRLIDLWRKETEGDSKAEVNVNVANTNIAGLTADELRAIVSASRSGTLQA